MASTQEVKVPDIGGASGVDVIEILVKEGESVEKETPLITLESDKASMEIPSPSAGVVKSLSVKMGDKVSEGDVILLLEPAAEESSHKEEKEPEKDREEAVKAVIDKQMTEILDKPEEKELPSLSNEKKQTAEKQEVIHASPGVRRLARELGVNLTEIQGTGRKERISKEDIHEYIKARMQQGAKGTFGIPAAPEIDFSKFGEVESKPLNKIKRLTGENVHRSWVTIPHVTQFDEADITDLEAFRKVEIQRNKEEVKLTILAFVCKVVSKALAVFPQFNASLDASGNHLIYKHYFNIGIAVETPNGLVVPVIKGVDRLSVNEIAKEMARLSAKARDKGLMPTDMSGGCFTISSLGGIGGTAFTPIVNSPEVAILGLSRSSVKPVYIENEFKPRLMLPLSLSYDHRVIDGAEAARFSRYISESLSDIRRVLL
ncbi:Pyruvate dehydrogenase (dihydrolipoyltransacetylase component) E2p (plasmid) [Legionella adelaidensis]|uniref:Acetyltransferase component of pyruvate dehydrogenase complex n=1 Tax=Legionella adelaidensis TaxID=45056 RepID=A0A0W0R502_9GAMM|nr:dihydrolipoyllysine-residue acetyltransferase [Legionella adelaidensis]KTC66136.1 Pyruvate dehydrogenase (dihydrolipoyltransacetylase component) E2p [Legionella adelaidensis]VEH85648.1 Pyruvate dehydrogenase (dihydrolipoyltransacetylase component) E2p [Legionella adelaidensis]